MASKLSFVWDGIVQPDNSPVTKEGINGNVCQRSDKLDTDDNFDCCMDILYEEDETASKSDHSSSQKAK